MKKKGAAWKGVLLCAAAFALPPEDPDYRDIEEGCPDLCVSSAIDVLRPDPWGPAFCVLGSGGRGRGRGGRKGQRRLEDRILRNLCFFQITVL